MKNVLVPTRNTRGFFEVCKALEGRLSDYEVVGLGLVYGNPGLGKTMALEAYHARCRATGNILTYKVRAMSFWTDQRTVLRGLLDAMGVDPHKSTKDFMFDTVCEQLATRPAIFLLDEVDSIAESRRVMALLKDIHDVAGAAILMVGEERVDKILRRYMSFYNRINGAALCRMQENTEEDVTAVVTHRCEFAVAPEVCGLICQELGRSLRSVIDRIRDIEAFARVNNVSVIGLREYRQLTRGLATMGRTSTVLQAGRLAGGSLG